MNYLAHIYLSGDDDALRIGNFIADPIKGKSYLDYPQGIQRGIVLHRKIDRFTDTHPVVYKSTHRLFKKFRHYNGVIVDVFYDHFLAKNWKDYHSAPLEKYVADFYSLLEENYSLLPPSIQNFYPIMVRQNWLVSYAEPEGLAHILSQMSNRTKGNIDLHQAMDDLHEHYTAFEAEFTSFFKDLQAYCLQEIDQL